MRHRLQAERGERLDELLVDVTPAPVFAGLETANHRVMRAVKVFRRVPIGRIVAASDVSAFEAESQMHPVAPHLEAFLAAVGSARLLGLNVSKMLTLFAW